MRQVEHPDKLYIQISDESPNTLGFSFNDNPESNDGLDPNAFDQFTLFRITRMLANVFTCIERLRTDGTRIKSLNEQ